MQQPTQQIISLVQDIEHNSFELNVQMIKLNTVQDAIAQLMMRIDEIKYNGWDQDSGMALLSIGEIERTVRLIDMAFLPLKEEMREIVSELNKTSSKAFDLVVRENKKADAPTSTNETYDK